MPHNKSYFEKIVPEWLETAEGREFSIRQDYKDAWSVFLGGFGFNCEFTQTFRYPALSAELAITRTSRLLGKYFDSIRQRAAAFIVAEPHKSGIYHTHGLFKLQAQDDEHMEELLTGLYYAAHAQYGRCEYEVLENPEAYRQYILKHLNTRTPENFDYRFIGIKRKPVI